MVRKTGYFVYVYTERRWFSSLNRAKAYAIRQENYCDNVQIVDCATEKLVYASGLMKGLTSDSGR